MPGAVKIRHVIRDDGKEFQSMSAACRHFNYLPRALKHALEYGGTLAGHYWYWMSEDEEEKTPYLDPTSDFGWVETTENAKARAVRAWRAGVPIDTLCSRFSVTRETIYEWLKEAGVDAVAEYKERRKSQV